MGNRLYTRDIDDFREIVGVDLIGLVELGYVDLDGLGGDFAFSGDLRE